MRLVPSNTPGPALECNSTTGTRAAAVSSPSAACTLALPGWVTPTILTLHHCPIPKPLGFRLQQARPETPSSSSPLHRSALPEPGQAPSAAGGWDVSAAWTQSRAWLTGERERAGADSRATGHMGRRLSPRAIDRENPLCSQPRDPGSSRPDGNLGAGKELGPAGERSRHLPGPAVL